MTFLIIRRLEKILPAAPHGKRTHSSHFQRTHRAGHQSNQHQLNPHNSLAGTRLSWCHRSLKEVISIRPALLQLPFFSHLLGCFLPTSLLKSLCQGDCPIVCLSHGRDGSMLVPQMGFQSSCQGKWFWIPVHKYFFFLILWNDHTGTSEDQFQSQFLPDVNSPTV